MACDCDGFEKEGKAIHSFNTHSKTSYGSQNTMSQCTKMLQKIQRHLKVLGSRLSFKRVEVTGNLTQMAQCGLAMGVRSFIKMIVGIFKRRVLACWDTLSNLLLVMRFMLCMGDVGQYAALPGIAFEKCHRVTLW